MRRRLNQSGLIPAFPTARTPSLSKAYSATVRIAFQAPAPPKPAEARKLSIAPALLRALLRREAAASAAIVRVFRPDNRYRKFGRGRASTPTKPPPTQLP